MTFHRRPDRPLAFAIACLGQSSAGGNMIGSVIEGVTRIAPSHSHGDYMHQQATAHVLRWASM